LPAAIVAEKGPGTGQELARAQSVHETVSEIMALTRIAAEQIVPSAALH
jgi:hypothetical protein